MLNLNTLKKRMSNLSNLWKSEGQESIETPQNTLYKFKLVYKELEVGFLTLNNGEWNFQYSDEFISQDHLSPLPDFPDVHKEYKSEALYPFFLHRIPSLSQPKVQRQIAKDKIDASNEAELLKVFGRISLTNPFRLIAA